MQARVSAAYHAASSQTASVRVFYPLKCPRKENSNNSLMTDRPVERHDTLGIRCGHINLPLATRARGGRAHRTRVALRRVDRRVHGTHLFADDRSW